MANLVDLFPQILELAVEWVWQGEVRILREGRPLDASELEDARAAGVCNPARVRILVVPQIPRPDAALLREANEQVQLITEEAGGLTCNYGIYIHESAEGDRRLLLHELVHVAQFERLGGIKPFLNQYLLECLRHGYNYSPLERESDEVSRRILHG